LFESFIDSQQRRVTAIYRDVNRIKVNVFCSAASLVGALAPGTVNQYPPHRLGSSAEKMRAIGQTRLAIGTNELQPGIVDQSGGLKGVIAAISGELLLCHPMQLRINQMKQLLLSTRLAAISRFEKSRDVAHPQGMLPKVSKITSLETQNR